MGSQYVATRPQLSRWIMPQWSGGWVVPHSRMQARSRRVNLCLDLSLRWLNLHTSMNGPRMAHSVLCVRLPDSCTHLAEVPSAVCIPYLGASCKLHVKSRSLLQVMSWASTCSRNTYNCDWGPEPMLGRAVVLKYTYLLYVAYLEIEIAVYVYSCLAKIAGKYQLVFKYWSIHRESNCWFN